MKASRHIMLLGVSVVIIFFTLLVPKAVTNKSEMTNLKLGYPLHFVTQDVSNYDPPFFPQNYGFQSIWEFPAKVSWLNGIISLGIILAVLELANYALQKKS